MRRPHQPLLVAGLLVALMSPALLAPADASHWDDHYDETLVGPDHRVRDTMHEVVIIPPHHGQIYNGNGILNDQDLDETNAWRNSYLVAVERSIQMWRDAIDELGPNWLADDFTIKTYVLGRDDVTADLITRADTIVIHDETKGAVIGLGIRAVMVADQACIVDNSMLYLHQSFTYQDMFYVNAHEFGHCLGIGHVDYHPDDDLMSEFYPGRIGNANGRLYCVSNLNMLALEAATQHLDGMPPGPEDVRMPVQDYGRMDCQDRYWP